MKFLEELVEDHAGDVGRAWLLYCDVPNWMDHLALLLHSRVEMAGVCLEWVALDDVGVLASSLDRTDVLWGKDVDVDCSEEQVRVGG